MMPYGLLTHFVYKDTMMLQMSVNTADKVANSDIADIISKLKTDDNTVGFKGYTHDKKGFVLQLAFMEIIDDLQQFKDISNKYSCEPVIDLNNRCVNLYFNKKPKTGYNVVYLSIIMTSIYYLCNKFLLKQNYTNPI